MGGFKHNEAKSQYGGRPGKIDTPLDEKLKSVKWGTYKLGDLFDIQNTLSFNSNMLVDGTEYDYITRTSINQGILQTTGFINERNINPPHTWSLGLLQMDFFYRTRPWYAGQFVRKIVPKINIPPKAVLFFQTLLNRQKPLLMQVLVRNVDDTFRNIQVQLPINSEKKIDFVFMEGFVRELEESRLRELEAYLLATGLSNYKLSSKEQSVINRLSSQKWKEFDVTKVFNVCNTHNILSSEIKPDSGTIPYLCASSENNGVSSYISHDKRLIEKGNCVFIGGKTFVVSYQKTDFFSNDSHNLALHLMNYAPTKANQLYLACCITKSLGHKYSWGDSISKAKIKNDKITLPEKSGKPDFETMEILISAVQKLVIKDVVLYADCRLAATKQAISR